MKNGGGLYNDLLVEVGLDMFLVSIVVGRGEVLLMNDVEYVVIG